MSQTEYIPSTDVELTDLASEALQMTDPMRLSEIVVLFMKRKDISATLLAQQMGVVNNTVTRIKQGTASISSYRKALEYLIKV